MDFYEIECKLNEAVRRWGGSHPEGNVWVLGKDWTIVVDTTRSYNQPELIFYRESEVPLTEQEIEDCKGWVFSYPTAISDINLSTYPGFGTITFYGEHGNALAFDVFTDKEDA